MRKKTRGVEEEKFEKRRRPRRQKTGRKVNEPQGNEVVEGEKRKRKRNEIEITKNSVKLISTNIQSF